MATWPDTMQLALLTADFRQWENGDSLEAVVYISSPNALTSQTDNVIVPRLEERIDTSEGTMAEELPVNNDPQWLPNDWSYLVRAIFSTGRKMAWIVAFPGTGGDDQTYDLADIGVEIPYPTDLGPFVVVYPLPPVTGGGGGGGDVLDVFGRTGHVVAQTGDYATAQITGLVASLAAKADKATTISAGTGLSGGGDLSANRSLAVTYGSGVGTAAQGNDSRLSDARTPIAHAASHASGGGSDPVTLAESQITGLVADLAAKAPTANPTFTGTVSGITKGAVGLGSVDNTSDTGKPVSTAQGAADSAVLSSAQAYTDALGSAVAGTLSGKADKATTVSAGTGLTGGGDLSANRTLTVAYGTSGTTAAVGNDARLSDARTPIAHAASHATAGGDAVTLTQAQIIGLVAALAGLQPLDPDLTAIAGQTATTNNFLVGVASAWASRTPAQAKAALAIAEADVTNLVSDLALKSPIASPTFTGIVTAPRIRKPYLALTPGATVATDSNLGERFEFTAGQNFTLSNPTNLSDGDMLLWKITQDGTGSRIMTLGSLFSFGSLITAAVLSTGINKIDYLGAIYESAVTKLHVISFAPGY